MATTAYDSLVLATSGLVGYWSLDDAGSTAVDQLSANNGTVVNGSTTGVSLGFAGGDVGMTLASASSQHITIPTSANYQFGTGAYSLECWFFRSADPATSEFLINRGVASTGGHGFEIFLNGTAGGETYASSRIGAVTVNTAYPVAWTWGGIWHHIVITMTRAGSGQMYVDGATSGAGAVISGESAFSVSEAATTYLGRVSSGGNYLNGGIAKVAFYNTVLSAGTVSSHYAGRLLPAAVNAGALGSRRRRIR